MASLSDPLVQELLHGRFIATLATSNPDGSMNLTAVWYFFDGEYLYVATSSRSRKGRNAKERAKASLMVDSRDPRASRGVTCAGAVDIVRGDASQELNQRIHRTYLSEAALADGRIGPVFAAWDDITLRIKPSSVFAWDMRVADQQFFGGAMSTPGYLLEQER
jgi:nitroimidazol reductase NimA-like FMN-containing flavoprotein (pyridoxamine 5'-phosphate oxidase superfamily)